MLAFVPVTLAIYRPLKPRLRWAMQCLVSFADHAGRCFPSIRTFAQHAGISKIAAGRDLAELTEAGYVTRKRRPGGVFVGAWTVCEQNRLVSVCFGLPEVNKA
jgi:DNA-binding transcriptional MocR family regulator